MTIEEAIRARLDRFNKLWLVAEGHTFEDDPKIKRERYDADIKVWNEKMEKRLKEIGFQSEADYRNEYYENIDNPVLKVDEIIDSLWKTKPIYNSLYDYEILCINEGKGIAEYILAHTPADKDIHDVWMELWGEDESLMSFTKNLEKMGYKVRDDHSGNSMGMSVLFANSLLFNRDIFPYLHGALAPLVGDKGYHDDRKDIPKELVKKEI